MNIGHNPTRSALHRAKSGLRLGLRAVLAGVLFFTSLTSAALTSAEEQASLTATYLGNEGIMVAQGGTKVVFDPLYQNTYGTYQSVPEETREALLSAQEPFDGLQALFVSHSHGDHFSASDLVRFVAAHPDAYVVAPTQAIDALKGALKEADQTPPDSRLVSVALDYGDAPLELNVGQIKVEAVRIAHAGGDERRSIENILYRVTFPGEAVVSTWAMPIRVGVITSPTKTIGSLFKQMRLSHPTGFLPRPEASN